MFPLRKKRRISVWRIPQLENKSHLGISCVYWSAKRKKEIVKKTKAKNHDGIFESNRSDADQYVNEL